MVSLSTISTSTPNIKDDGLGEVDILDKQLHGYFQSKFLVQPSLTRLLVSFQARRCCIKEGLRAGEAWISFNHHNQNVP
jgi:hypothetical protein